MFEWGAMSSCIEKKRRRSAPQSKEDQVPVTKRTASLINNNNWVQLVWNSTDPWPFDVTSRSKQQLHFHQCKCDLLFGSRHQAGQLISWTNILHAHQPFKVGSRQRLHKTAGRQRVEQ